MWSWAGWDGSPSVGPATSNAAESVLCEPRPDQIPLRKACAETPDFFLPPDDNFSTLLFSLPS